MDSSLSWVNVFWSWLYDIWKYISKYIFLYRKPCCLNWNTLPSLCAALSPGCRWIFYPGYFWNYSKTTRHSRSQYIRLNHPQYPVVVLESFRTLALSVSSYLLFLQLCLGERLAFARIIGKLMFLLLCPLEKSVVWESACCRREIVLYNSSLHRQRCKLLVLQESVSHDIGKVMHCLHTV